MQLTLVYVNAFVRKSPGEKSLELTYNVIDRICARDVHGARQAVRELTIQTLADIGVEVQIWGGT